MNKTILLVGNPGKEATKKLIPLCERAGFAISQIYPNIAALRSDYPHYYRNPVFRDETPPLIIADPELPGTMQILGPTLPPVLLLPAGEPNKTGLKEKAFSIIDPDFPEEAVKAILSSAEKQAALLQRFFLERHEGRDAIDNLNEVIFSVDSQGNFIYVSSVIRNYSLDPKDVTGRSVFEFVHPEDHEYLRERIKAVMSGKADSGPSFYRIIDGHGVVRHVRTSSRLVHQRGKPLYITEVLTDQTEQSLRQKEILKLTQAVEQSANVIVITDLEGKIEFVNKAFELSTGYSREEAVGKNPSILKTDFLSPEVYRELWKKISKGEVWEGRFHNRRKDGSTYWEKAIISPIRGDKGKIINYVAVKEDITRELAYQRELEEAKELAEEANRLKSEFLANMSHEIRTPLNVILGFTALLIEENRDTETGEQLSLIQESGRNLLALINDILDFSKIEANKLALERASFNPAGMIGDLKKMFTLEAAKKELRFFIKTEEGIPEEIEGDQFRIRQILINLLGNAFKFTEKGSVSLSCSYDRETAHLICSVEDTGIGIPKESREQIFHPFEQIDGSAKRKFSGTGLGLSITRRLVHLMGGSLALQSEAGTGSTFTIRLPAASVAGKYAKIKESLSEDRIPQNCTAESGEDMERVLHILVAEDNNLNQELMKLLIGRLGHTCGIAENGKVALDMLKKNCFDLLLLDMQMPVMDGMETIVEIRKDPDIAHIPVIALTASAMKGDAERFLEAGCNDYLAKPIDKNLLELKLEALK
jgi:PAS domain S-box-containing protein